MKKNTLSKKEQRQHPFIANSVGLEQEVFLLLFQRHSICLLFVELFSLLLEMLLYVLILLNQLYVMSHKKTLYDTPYRQR